MHRRMFSCIPASTLDASSTVSPTDISKHCLMFPGDGDGEVSGVQNHPMENHCFRPESLIHQRALGSSAKLGAAVLIMYRQDSSKSPLLTTGTVNIGLTVQPTGNTQCQSMLALCSHRQGMCQNYRGSFKCTQIHSRISLLHQYFENKAFIRTVDR